ncbi:Uu.00g068710.m01.CDS01 [Anthostomella pinea]|uniref:Uu.00g068710.m01.CDS01 n=1 Tax=Anthostomella pinea TaxID=933095 RepID=A0AAI8VNS9_9PEZI|nr:Uu.00g068710.m01.CDS01 [Anthostomella pinea]
MPGIVKETSSFECMCALPFATLVAGLDITDTWIAGSGARADLHNTQMKAGRLVHVPILYSTSTDEDTAIGYASVDTVDLVEYLYPTVLGIGCSPGLRADSGGGGDKGRTVQAHHGFLRGHGRAYATAWDWYVAFAVIPYLFRRLESEECLFRHSQNYKHELRAT